jgi:hypothetical protein
MEALRRKSAQSGEPLTRIAERYIDEGMRIERHPGIFFRDGPAGRRAVLVGGPDVWQVIAAVRGADERGEKLIAAVAEGMGMPPEKVRTAVRYYAEYPDEIDDWIDSNVREAEDLERALERARQSLA